MFCIGICDDDSIILRELQQMIARIRDEWKYQWKVCTFETVEAILEQAEELNVAFLDIEMPKMDGIELGKKITERNPGCKIIMATAMVERFKDAFRIQALRFVTKPFEKREVEEALRAAMESSYVSRFIELYYQRNKYKVRQEDIRYVEAYNGYTEFAIGGQRFRKESSLTELEEMLDEKLFVRIERRYIVNLRWIGMCKGDSIQIEDKKFVISRRRRKEFEQRYIEYDLKYRGKIQ